MIFVIVPAFNEAQSIREVIKDLRDHGYTNIVVVDDCSQDTTYQVAQETGVHVLHHIINCGQGASLRTGIEYALIKGATIIVTFDADGQHHAEDVKSLVDALQDYHCDAALGSRFLEKKGNTPFIRKLFLKGGTVICLMMYDVTLTDTHNGIRAMTRKAAHILQFESDGMEHASEILELIGKHKLRYCEVPVTITYSEYSIAHGQSTWNAFRILYKMIVKKFTG